MKKRRVLPIACFVLTGAGCAHQSRESFETWSIVFLAILIGLAFWIDHARRN